MTVQTVTLDTQQFPNPYLEQSHLQLDIESETFTSPSDGRELGVIINAVVLELEKSRTELAIEALVWALLAAGLAWAASGRYSIGWSAIISVGTLFSLGILGATYQPRGISPVVETGLAGLAWLVALLSTPRKHPAIAVGLGLVCLWMVVAGRVMGDWQMDDAYISYRYAWNLLNGNGLVYNPGEIVEGYTNFSWTLFAAASLGLGLSPAGVSLAANIALSIGLVAVTHILARRLWGGAVVPLVASALIGVDGAALTYGARGSGMESMAFSFLLMLAAALIWTGRKASRRLSLAASGIVLALAVLTRPEGFLVAAIFVGVLAWGLRSQARVALRSVLSVLVPFLSVVVPYEAWRITFYGYPFPNTFYAKTGSTTALFERGGNYVSIFLGERWLLAGLALAALALMMTARRGRLQATGVAFALLIATYSLYIVWVGGDHFPGWRFLLPLVAPMAILSVGAVRALIDMTSSRQGRTFAWSILLLALSAYGVGALWMLEPQSVNAELTALHTSYVNRWGSAGLWLREATPETASAAAKGAGAIAYYSQRPVIDVYGLNDLHIGHLQMLDMGSRNAGHDKEDPAYVLDRRPDYILDEWVNYFDSVKSRLKQAYEYHVARAPTGVEIAWWRRKDAPGP